MNMMESCDAMGGDGVMEGRKCVVYSGLVLACSSGVGEQ